MKMPRKSILSLLAAATLLLVLPIGARADGPIQDACAGSPKEAILTLPPPLGEWGRIVCTPYGHVIGANEGWIWSIPATFYPVWIPAQMARESPAPLGNAAYFTRIEMKIVTGGDAEPALAVFRKRFPHDDKYSGVYRLDVTSSAGKSVRLYFVAYDTPWGVWCSERCEPDSVFMLLNLRKRHGG